MSKRKSSGAVLIVVELGAEWPAVPEVRDPGCGRRVLAQAEGESPTGFAARVGEQLDGLFGRGASMTCAVVACNERLDDVAARARAELARIALGAMAKQAKHYGGSLLLCASERSSGRLRHALSSMATELAAEWQRAHVVTTVRFGDAAIAPTSSDMSDRVGARRSKDANRKVA